MLSSVGFVRPRRFGTASALRTSSASLFRVISRLRAEWRVFSTRISKALSAPPVNPPLTFPCYTYPHPGPPPAHPDSSSRMSRLPHYPEVPPGRAARAGLARRANARRGDALRDRERP